MCFFFVCTYFLLFALLPVPWADAFMHGSLSLADAADAMLEVCKVEMKKADIGKCFSIVNV